MHAYTHVCMHALRLPACMHALRLHACMHALRLHSCMHAGSACALLSVVFKSLISLAFIFRIFSISVCLYLDLPNACMHAYACMHACICMHACMHAVLVWIIAICFLRAVFCCAYCFSAYCFLLPSLLLFLLFINSSLFNKCTICCCLLSWSPAGCGG